MTVQKFDPTASVEVDRHVSIKKADAVRQVVYGEVYVPNVPDSQGDFMNAEEITQMAWRFCARGASQMVDKNHDNKMSGAAVVETFIARKGDPEFAEGAWVVGVWCPDEVWKSVERGELNGFSMQASVFGVPGRTLELWVPEELDGATHEADGHSHLYLVKFDDEGKISGGRALARDPSGRSLDHTHTIVKGTVTEAAMGHTHRFAVMDRLMALQKQFEQEANS